MSEICIEIPTPALQEVMEAGNITSIPFISPVKIQAEGEVTVTYTLIAEGSTKEAAFDLTLPKINGTLITESQVDNKLIYFPTVVEKLTAQFTGTALPAGNRVEYIFTAPSTLEGDFCILNATDGFYKDGFILTTQTSGDGAVKVRIENTSTVTSGTFSGTLSVLVLRYL